MFLLAARRAPYRSRAPRIRKGTKWTTAPYVDGCMKYSTYWAGRYWSSKSSKYSTCGSRRYRSKYCVDNPVCEPKSCGTGYEWNKETQVGDTMYACCPMSCSCVTAFSFCSCAAHVPLLLPTYLPQDRTGGASSPCVTCMLVHCKGL